MTLTIAVAYGGREEIADAVRDLIRAKVRDGLGVDETRRNTSPPLLSTNNLYTVGLPDPDLIIRTAARCDYRASVMAKRFIVNSTLRRLLAGVP